MKFGIYKNGVFHEQFFSFDPISRVISAGDFQRIEKGLVQRVCALNEFLFDIYAKMMNVGVRITKAFCQQLFDGILNQMKSLGMWTGETAPVREPIISEGREVGFVNSDDAGIFVPCAVR